MKLFTKNYYIVVNKGFLFMRYFNLVIFLFGFNSYMYAQNNAEYYYDKGCEVADLGKFKEAIKYYDKAIDLDPKIAKNYNNRGEAKMQLKDFEGALNDYNKAIELKPKSIGKAYYNRGNVKMETEDFVGAVEDYSFVIEMESEHTHSYYNRGLAKAELGNIKEACSDWSIAGDLGLMEAYLLVNENCK